MSVSHLHGGSIDRIPPHNLEAEMALIGSVLVDREIMEKAGEIVRPSDFYAHVHETIFAVLIDLFDRGEPLDKITVAEALRTRDQLEKVGGLSYLSSLMDTVQTAASAGYYAKLIREKAVLRALIHAGTQITQLGYEAEEDVDAALDQSEQMVYTIGERQMKGDFMAVNRLMKDAFEHIDRLFHARGDRTGVTSGFRDIDNMTTGFQAGNFVIVAARPGMGKTSFALNMAVAAARESKEPIAFFSLEMSNSEVIQRLICAEAQLSMHDLRRGNIKQHQWEDISRAMGSLNELPIYLDDTGALSVTEVRSRCRRLKSHGGLGAVFVDYLQLLRPGVLSRNVNRNEELSEICRTMKVTAKDLGVPIIALAQLNRGVESRNDKRPMLADLRDCLSGDALVTNADTGERIAVRTIVEQNLRFNVWAVDNRLKLTRKPIVDAWSVGEREVFRMVTRSGRTLQCTAGHRLLTLDGWSELRDLNVGDAIAVPRRYGAPAWHGTPISRGRAASRLVPARRSYARYVDRIPLVVNDRPTSQRYGQSILAEADVMWDEISRIESLRCATTYDITVGSLHNFCVDDIVTHNSGSLEQESDLVAFLFRDGYYNPEGPEPDVTEFIIAKHRNGPTGTVKLRFQKEFTLFVPYADESHFPPP